MGSLGWTQCYWCPYWVYDPHILDWIGRPLCNACWDWHFGYDHGMMGGPYEPTARQRAATLLTRWLPIDDVACETISEFLIEWHEP